MQRRILFIIIFLGLTLVAHTQPRNLDFYLTEGLQNSPLLKDYKNQINLAVADSVLVSAAKKPLVEAKSQLMYSPFYNNFGYDEVITDGGNYMAVMGVTQNIFNKRELTNKYRAIDIQKQIVNTSSKVSSSELKKIITEQYLISYTDLTDFQFNKTFLDLFAKETEIIQQFVKNGVARQTDYLSLLVEMQAQEIQVTQLKNQYRKDLTTLNKLCGLSDTTSYELSEPQLKIDGIPDISRTPSYILFKIDSLKIENEKTAIDIRYKPKVNWFADAGFLTSNPWNFYKHFGYSAGIGLNIPVYDGKQRNIEKQKLEFNENTRQGYESNYKNQYFQQIQQLSDELKSLDEITLQLKNQLITSDQLVKALKNQLEAGIIQMTEYINAIKSYKSITRNLNLIENQKYLVINEMNFILTQ